MSLILSGTDGLSDVDGTAATPAIRGTDANTGIFFGTDIIGFSEGGVEAMRIDSAGNVGVGTATPNSRMSVAVSSTSTSVLGTYANIPLLLQNTSSTDNNWTVIGVQDAAGDFSSYIGTQNTSQASNTAIMAFATNGGSGATERMRIDSSGYVLVNKTSATTYGSIFAQAYTSNTSGQQWLQVWDSTVAAGSCQGLYVTYTAATPNGTGNEFIFCTDQSAQRFVARSNGGLANYSANNANLSDRREKTNFAPAKSYLDVICAIPVQTFNYIDQNREEDDGLTLGVVAQDVQAVAPELVSESDWSLEKDGSKMRLSIYQTDLQYALMKCIQEQQALITALTARITALETP